MRLSSPTVPAPVIRRAGLGDGGELARLRWDFSPEEVSAGVQPWAGFSDQFTTFIEEALQGDDWVVWVADAEGRLVANVFVFLARMVPRPGRFGRRFGYVTNVYTEPAYRNAGIGSAMMSEIVNWARGEALELLIVWPSEEAVMFYERAGFARSPDAMELPLEEGD